MRGRRCERDATVRRGSGSKSISQCTEDGAPQAFLEPRLGDRLGRAPGRAGTRPPARKSWARIAGRRQEPPWAGPQGSWARSVQREGGMSRRRAVPETGRRLGLPGWQLWGPSSWAAGASLPSRRAGPHTVSASELHNRAPGASGRSELGVTSPHGAGAPTLLTDTCMYTRVMEHDTPIGKTGRSPSKGLKKSTASGIEGPGRVHRPPARPLRGLAAGARCPGASHATSTRNLASNFLLVRSGPRPRGSFLATEAPRALTR